MDAVTSETESKQQNRKVQNIDHACSTEGCESAAPYGFKADGTKDNYRWFCSNHVPEGEIILNDGSKRFAVRGRG